MRTLQSKDKELPKFGDANFPLTRACDADVPYLQQMVNARLAICE
jgi:hypothetical protein